MKRYLLRLALMALTLFILSALIFFLSQILPGDVARTMLGPFAPEEQVQQLNHQLGFDRPLVVRYMSWLAGFVRGDWGESYYFKTPVLPLVLGRLWNSLKLAVVAIVLIVPLSVAMGLWAGLREGRLLDRAVTTVGLSLTAIPEFVSGVILLIVFGVALKWFPTTAQPPQNASPVDAAYHLILPAIPLMFVLFGYISRHARSGTIEVLEAPYVRSAFLKDLPRRRVITHHVLRNAMPATVTVVAMQCAIMISGLAVIEVLFTYPGLGKLTLDAANNHDQPLLQACALTVGLIITSINLLADIAYSLMNPRLRLSGVDD